MPDNLLADSFGLQSTKNLVLPHETVDEAVRRYVLSSCSRAITMTRDYRAWLIEATKRFEALRSTRSLDADDPGIPWHWASNVGVPLESMTAEQLTPRFNAATVDADPIFRVTTPVEDATVQKLLGTSKAEIEQRWTAWYQDFFTRKVRLRRVRDESFLNVSIDGDAFEGPEWEESHRQTARTVLLLRNSKGEILVGPEGQPKVFESHLPDEAMPTDPDGGKLTRMYVQQKGDQLLYKGVRVRPWRTSEVIWPESATTPAIDDLDWFTVQMWKSPSWFKTREGDPIEGKLKNVQELLARHKHGIPEEAKTREETALIQGLTFPAMPGKILVWLFFGRFDVDSDDVDEEIITLVAPKERILLGWRLSQFARRPFFHYQLYRMPGRFTGRGLPHVMKGMRDMIDFYANAANNRANLYLDPPMLYEADSGYDPDTMEFGTGAQWGPLNPGAIAGAKVRMLEMPQSQELLADKFINFYMSLAQRLSAVTDPNFGLPARGTSAAGRTLGGQALLLSENNVKHADWIKEFQEIAEEEAEFIDHVIAELADDQAIASMSDVQVPIQSFRLAKRFHATGNSQTMNRQAMQQVMLQLFDRLAQDPIFGLLPETQLQVRQKFLDLFDIDLTLPQKDQVEQVRVQQIAQALAQLKPEQLAEAILHVQQAQSSQPSQPQSGGVPTNGRPGR